MLNFVSSSLEADSDEGVKKKSGKGTIRQTSASKQDHVERGLRIWAQYFMEFRILRGDPPGFHPSTDDRRQNYALSIRSHCPRRLCFL